MTTSVIGPGRPANLFELAAAIAAIPGMPPIQRAQAAAALIQPAQELLGAERRTAVYQATRTAPYRTVGEALGVTEATINVAISQAPGLIFQFRVDGTDEWLGDEPPAGIGYETGAIFFDPSDKTLPFAGRQLIVRYGPVDDGARTPSLYAYATVNNKRMRATQAVHDLLFTHRGAPRR